MPKKKESFEDLYNELETTVSKLEEGNLSLDESLALYERGLLLARQCGEMLDRAELRLKELVPVNGLARMEEEEDEGDS